MAAAEDEPPFEVKSAVSASVGSLSRAPRQPLPLSRAEDAKRGGGAGTKTYTKPDPNGATKDATKGATTAPSGVLLSVGLVRQACPDLADWSLAPLESWRDVIDVAAKVRPALGISPDAMAEAETAMGAATTAICIAVILQKGSEVKSPGGYLRALTDKARGDGFNPAPMLFALLRQRSKLAPAQRINVS